MMKLISPYKLIFFALLSLLSLWGCVTVDVDNVQIDRIEVSLYPRFGIKPVEDLIPGQIYNLRLKIYSHGKTYGNINYLDIHPSSYDDSLKIVSHNKNQIVVRAEEDVFRALNMESFNLEVTLGHSGFPPFEASWGLDLNNDYLDLSGESGFSTLIVNGTTRDGHGKDGVSGEPGRDLILLACLYRTGFGEPGEQDVLLLVDLERMNIHFTDKRIFTINSKGGMGGDGARGNSGKNGGTGGDGGDGGDVRILYSNSDLIYRLKIYSTGGLGGNPGSEGDYIIIEENVVVKGHPGLRGRDGRDGKVEFIAISEKEVEKILSDLHSPFLDLRQIVHQ